MNAEISNMVELEYFPRNVNPDLSGAEFTSKADLKALAAHLVAAEACANILRRVGNYGRFTDDERRVLDDAIRNFVQENVWGKRDPFLLFVGTALARRLLSGEIHSVNSPEADAFLDDRYFNHSGKGEWTVGNYATVDEVLELARYMFANADLQKQIVRYRQEGIAPTEAERNWCFGLEHEFRCEMGLGRRSGLSNVYHIIRALFDAELSSLDAPAARLLIANSLLIRK